MRLIERKRIAEHTAAGAPLCTLITYIDSQKPVLLRRTGWEIGDDVHDDFRDAVSEDNGRTWSAPRPSLSRVAENGGYTIFVENTVLYSPGRDILIHFVDQIFQQQLEGSDSNSSSHLRITVDHPQAFLEGTTQPLVSDFGLKQGLCVSFCHPLETSAGQVLVPVQWQAVDEDQKISSQGFATRKDMPDILSDVWESALLVGTWNADNTLDWQLGNPVPYDFQGSSRGMCEGTVAELAGSKLALVLRGSNAAWLDRPSYKWLVFSEDGGLNWTQAQPLACDDGTLLQSSATGSALFRSFKNQKLYWIGNLCREGEQAQGNFPRSPLYIAEVQEEPFALRRDTLTEIAGREAHEGEAVQNSNFRFYQDRETAEVVLYFTRYGERGSEGRDWMLADCYEYRVALD